MNYECGGGPWCVGWFEAKYKERIYDRPEFIIIILHKLISKFDRIRARSSLEECVCVCVWESEELSL